MTSETKSSNSDTGSTSSSKTRMTGSEQPTSKAKPTLCPEVVLLGIFRVHGHCLHTVAKQFARKGCNRDKGWRERQECCRCDLRTPWKEAWWDKAIWK